MGKKKIRCAYCVFLVSLDDDKDVYHGLISTDECVIGFIPRIFRCPIMMIGQFDVLARIIGLLRVHALNSRLRYCYFYSLVAVPACYKL